MKMLAFIDWNVSPEIFAFGFLKIRWYGLLYVAGLMLGYYVLAYFFKKENKKEKDLESLMMTLVLSVIIGARLGHCLFYDPIYYLSNPLKILMIWQGGLSSHGAAIMILITMWFYSNKRKPDITMMWLLDRIVIGVALAGTLIRIGNFFNHEIVGIESDLPWAVMFHQDSNPAHAAVARHPAQLYEALSYFVIFLILFFRYKKYTFKIPKGQTFGIFLVLTFSARFFIEMIKEEQSVFESAMLLNMGQLLSIPFIIAGIVFLIWSRKNVYRDTDLE
jgi:phosphatidylglycerol:prolipoprotein diacylglycerol transferase